MPAPSIQTDGLPASLLACRSRYLSWVTENVCRFDPRSPSEEDRGYSHKAFAELCLAIYLIVQFEGLDAVPAPITELIRNVISDGNFIESGRANPFGVLAYVYPALLVDCLASGVGVQLKYYVTSVLSSTRLLSKERAPHRIADILFGRWLFTRLDSDRREIENVWWMSNGRYTPHAAINSLEDYYAYTHNVFYVSGFGLFQPRQPGEALLQAVGSGGDQELALWRFLAESNWDIAIEIVLTQMLLSQSATPGTMAVLVHIFECSDELGYIPGPPASRRSRLKHIGSHWLRHYHTTLVGIIFCTLAMRAMAQPFLASILEINSTTSLGALLASGKMLSDVQHHRRVKSRELKERSKLISASPDLHAQLEEYLTDITPEFKTWRVS
jgi:hypothetical protein